MIESGKMILNFESLDEILRCDHSNEFLSQHFCMVLFEFQNFKK